VALLSRLRQSSNLPRPLAVLLPFFEKRLAGLPADPEEKLPADLRRARDRLAYGELARQMIKRNLQRDLVLLLDREARQSSGLAWAREGLTRLVLEELVAAGPRLEVILKTARDLASEKSSPLSASGRALLATLALYGKDEETARELDAGVAKAGRDGQVVLPLAIHLGRHDRLDAAIRLLASWISSRKEAVTWEEHATLAKLYERARRLHNARQSWQKALEALPKTAPQRGNIRKRIEALKTLPDESQ
jgi:hypothetical protein